MSDTIYDVEVEMMAKVREWASPENEPSLDFYFVSHIVINDEVGEQAWRYYPGDEARFERVTA